ncbi:MAG: hypothetical protein AB1772_01255 [Candidatus Zixiibacteriota bacterium]
MESLKSLTWYRDRDAARRGEPGIVHSYMASEATVLHHLSGALDPVWLMGSSGFAFRIMASPTLCPSAMSVFQWRKVLPEAFEQVGYGCTHISRLWDEGESDAERREEAHRCITESLDSGVPCVVWDMHQSEWGVISGYNHRLQVYLGLSYLGEPVSLPFDNLGRNGIDILSVIIPGNRTYQSKSEAVLRALRTAVDHADQRKWNDRPKYQDGPLAYDAWSTALGRWADIVERGDPDRIGVDICAHARYYASHYFSARCYAREFLASIAGDISDLVRATKCFADTAVCLRPVWNDSPRSRDAESVVLKTLSSAVRDAKAAESEGIEYIRNYLATCQ